MQNLVTIDDLGYANVTKGNDVITIDGTKENVIVPSGKGSDTITFTNISDVKELSFQQVAATKDLRISYEVGLPGSKKIQTVTITDYFTSISGDATKSSVKNLTIGESSYVLTDVFVNQHGFTPDKKGVIKGTDFSDVIHGTNAPARLSLGGDFNVNEPSTDITASGSFGLDVGLSDIYYGGIEKIIESVSLFLKGNIDIMGYAGSLDLGIDVINKAAAQKANPSAGVDKIFAGAGDDIIDAGTGDDFITGGTGNNTVIFYSGDGHDTINLTKGENLTIKYYDSRYYLDDEVFVKNVSIKEVGKDVVIKYTYAPANTTDIFDLTLSTESITLKGFANKDLGANVTLETYRMDPDSHEYLPIGSPMLDETGTPILDEAGKPLINNKININDYVFQLDVRDADKKGAVNGTWLNEQIDVSKAAKAATVNTGSGNDEIKGSRFADKINITGSGEKTVYIEAVDGNDIITGVAKADKMTLIIKGMDDNNSTSDVNETVLNFVKKGNDLVFERKVYIDDKGNQTTEQYAESYESQQVYVKADGTLSFEYPYLDGNNKITEKLFYNPVTGLYSVNELDGYVPVYLDKDGYLTTEAEGNILIENGLFTNGHLATDDNHAAYSPVNEGWTRENQESLGTTTIKDYFKKANELADLTVNGQSVKDASVLIEGKGKVNGTKLNDIIVGSAKADKITTGIGNDTIIAGEGKDTITVNGGGIKTFVIGKNDGNDTIKMSTKADLSFKFDSAVKTNYIKTGNDLIISNMYDNSNSVQTTTIKNYYKYADAESKLTVNDQIISDTMIATQVTGSKKNSTYDSASLAASTNNSSRIIVSDPKGNDIYNITSFDTDIIIDDKSGTDTLNLGIASDKMSLYFDVNAETGKSGSLYIAGTAQDAIDGNALEILNYFGDGKIETISSSDTNDMSIDVWVDKITADVQSWLTANNYADTAAVFEANNADDVTALIAVYQNANYASLTPDQPQP